MDIAQEDLAGKVVLEVGSGRGGTTQKLVDLLSGQFGATLIVTDISDAYFPQLREAFQERDVQAQFICTDASDLNGVEDNSVDYLVCAYALCAINTQAGLATLALQRFLEVLKSGGRLLIEEEFPIDTVDTPIQEVWAEKWRILKSATILTGRFPYTEFSPSTLAALCRLVGFEEIEWMAETERYQGVAALDFFQRRLERLLPQLPNDNLRTGFRQWAMELREKAVQVGGMEIPFYRLTARKADTDSA